MDENEILDSGTEEEITEAEELKNTDEVDEGDDGGFEYDEDGNIIVGSEDESEEKDEAAEEDTDTDDNEDGANADEPEDKTAEELKAQPTANHATTANSSNNEFTKFKRQAKEMLEKLGVQNVTEEGLLEAMIKMTAEASDTTVEDYKAELKRREEAEAAKNAELSAAYERVTQADLAALKAVYPELKDIKRIDELPNWQDFGRLRSIGVSPLTAYKNACADEMAKRMPSATKTAEGTKTHLRSAMGKSAKAGSSGPSMSELKVLRDSFPDLSDREIIKLYNKTKN